MGNGVIGSRFMVNRVHMEGFLGKGGMGAVLNDKLQTGRLPEAVGRFSSSAATRTAPRRGSLGHGSSRTVRVLSLSAPLTSLIRRREWVIATNRARVISDIIPGHIVFASPVERSALEDGFQVHFDLFRALLGRCY